SPRESGVIFMFSWAVPSWQHSNTRLVLCVFPAHDGVYHTLLCAPGFLTPLPVELCLDIDTLMSFLVIYCFFASLFHLF
ncbi:hypothetical protein BDW75DRAFT_198138, partial [Aspergillus navahoensis]